MEGNLHLFRFSKALVILMLSHLIRIQMWQKEQYLEPKLLDFSQSYLESCLSSRDLPKISRVIPGL